MKKKLVWFLVCLLVIILGVDIYFYLKCRQLRAMNWEMERDIREYENVVGKVADYEDLFSKGTDVLNLHKELEDKRNGLLEQKGVLDEEINKLESEIVAFE